MLFSFRKTLENPSAQKLSLIPLENSTIVQQLNEKIFSGPALCVKLPIHIIIIRARIAWWVLKMNSINWCSEHENLCRLNRERCSHSPSQLKWSQINESLCSIFNCIARFTGFDKWAAHTKEKSLIKYVRKLYIQLKTQFSSKNSYEFLLVCISEYFFFSKQNDQTHS